MENNLPFVVLLNNSNDTELNDSTLVSRMKTYITPGLNRVDLKNLKITFNLEQYIVGEVRGPFEYGQQTNCFKFYLQDISDVQQVVVVELFNDANVLSGCIKEGDFLLFTGVKIQILRIPEIMKIYFVVKVMPEVNKNFKIVHGSRNAIVSPALEEKEKLVCRDIADLQVDSSVKDVMEVIGVVIHCSKFVSDGCHPVLILADMSVDMEAICSNKSETSRGPLHITHASKRFVQKCSVGDVLKVSKLKVTSNASHAAGALNEGSSGIIFHVLSENDIAFSPINSKVLLNHYTFCRVKDLFNWWKSKWEERIRDNVLQNALLVCLAPNDVKKCQAKLQVDHSANPVVTKQDMPLGHVEQNPFKIPLKTVIQKIPYLKQKTLRAINEEMYFDILCQVVARYDWIERQQIVLKIWDGTKFPSTPQIEQLYNVGEILEDEHLVDIAPYCVDIHVEGEHKQIASQIQLLEIVELRNVHARCWKKADGSDVYKFNMYSGKIRGRGIFRYSVDSTFSKKFSCHLEKLRMALRSVKTAEHQSFPDNEIDLAVAAEGRDEKASQTLKDTSFLTRFDELRRTHPVDLTQSEQGKKILENRIVLDDNRDKSSGTSDVSCRRSVTQIPDCIRNEPATKIECFELMLKRSVNIDVLRFSPNFLCCDPVSACRAETKDVKTIKDLGHPLVCCFIGALINIDPGPDNVHQLVKWFCPGCNRIVASEELNGFNQLSKFVYQCPCKSKRKMTDNMTTGLLQPVFIVRLRLCDQVKNTITTILWAAEAVNSSFLKRESFFYGYTPRDFLESTVLRQKFSKLFRCLCSTPDRLTETSWIVHCNLQSQLSAKNFIKYYNFNTKLKPYNDIVKLPVVDYS